jgi:glycosyltransferase involved in cell wall biosynthesis
VRVVITVVGHRTEHWTDYFQILAAQRGVELTLLLADVSPRAELVLRGSGDGRPGIDCHVVPHLLGEARTGHMASIMFRPGALGHLPVDRPDIVHVIGEAGYLSTWQVLRWSQRRWPGVPVSLYAAQNVVIRFPPPFPWLERRAYESVAHAVPITPAALAVLRAKGFTGAATIVPLGVDTRRFTPAPRAAPDSSRFTVGFVGRLEPHKGIQDLLTAAERLDTDLLVVGRGSLTPLVAAAAVRRPGRVQLVDWADHEQLPGLLRQMNLLALPSAAIVQRNVVPWVGIPLREQFGRVLVEAMACGVPVVGSDVGEIGHVIGPAGLSFPATDVAALTGAIATVRDDPTLARRLGEAGVNRARGEFSWDRAATTMCEIWRQLATAPAGGSRERKVMTP